MLLTLSISLNQVLFHIPAQTKDNIASCCPRRSPIPLKGAILSGLMLLLG